MQLSTTNNWICEANLEMEVQSPTWKPEKNTIKKLQELWNSLRTIIEPPKKTSAYMGYKGAHLKASDDREYYTFKDVVTFRNKNMVETRRDRGRRFEKLLLKSAPQGKIPDTLFMLEFE